MNNILHQIDQLYSEWTKAKISGEICDLLGRQQELQQQICQYDKFIFLTSDAAIASRWCNWEIGFGDAHKYATDKIAIFPIKQDNRDWTGSEFLQLFPSIEYYDGTTRYSDTHNLIPEGFYVKYHFDRKKILPLVVWLAN